jgi:hypothetical protein
MYTITIVQPFPASRHVDFELGDQLEIKARAQFEPEKLACRAFAPHLIPNSRHFMQILDALYDSAQRREKVLID